MSHIPLRSSDHSDSGFRLLVRATDSDAHTIELGGIRWTLTEYEHVPVADDAPGYACISYSWGRGRTENPFEADQFVSDRAIPVIEATVKALQPEAIWIDSFCVPSREPARGACLQRMGGIFGAATYVVVVLSKPCAAVLEQIRTNLCMDSAALPMLENDDWVTRAWTYQEIANSRTIRFVAEGGGSIAVDGDHLLNALGNSVSVFKKAEGIGAFEFRTRYPRIDGLEDVLAEYMISSFLQRFAYQAMVAMDRRYSERAEDFFNAMIGTLTSTPTDGSDGLRLPPAELFMRSCEANGDYSFIYCTAPRSALPGRRWRPVEGRIPAILCWHTYGDGQSGSLHPTHLQLNNLCRMTPGTVNDDTRKLLSWWLEIEDINEPPDSVAGEVLEHLQRIGFTGRGKPLEMESGYFFPQSVCANANECDIVVAAGVRWVHGAPGLLVARNGTDIYQFRDVGVFVGRIPKTGESINVS